MKNIPNDMFFAWVESEIAAGRSVRFRLKGVSMFPLLRSQKDEVVLAPCRAEELRVRDVVLFRYKGKHLLHRIIHIDNEKLSLQGDGSYIAKETCLREEVVGKMQALVRPSGKVIEVTNWRWKCASRLWPKSGLLRSLLLRFLHFFFDRPTKASKQA